MQIRIEASDLPGRAHTAAGLTDADDIHVGIQARNKPEEVVDLYAGNSLSATWTLDCAADTSSGEVVLTGPYIQDRLGGRFIYLSWVTVDDSGRPVMFRRAKLMLGAVPPAVLDAAVGAGRLTGRLRLTGAQGQPLSGSVRPPLIAWSAEPAE
jgi:hypothetical protein